MERKSKIVGLVNSDIQSYVDDMPLSDNLKKEILSSDSLICHDMCYQYFASIFSDVFTVSDEEVRLLNIAGWLYFQSIIYTDDVIDDNDLTKFSLISICQEESVKIFSSIFSLKHKFWKIWNVRREEYLSAILYEKKLFKQNKVTIEEYELLADAKSAFGKVAIDSLYCIDNRSGNNYRKLLESHRYSTIVDQIADDIEDFEEDLEKGQFNWAIYLLKQQNIPLENPVILRKYFYIKGVMSTMYQLAADYCDKAIDSLGGLEVPEWEKMLRSHKVKCLHDIAALEDYLKEVNSGLALSKEVK